MISNRWCVWEKQRDTEGGREFGGALFTALPANSSQVTLGERQDMSRCADRAEQPSSRQHSETEWSIGGETAPTMHITSRSVWSGLTSHSTGHIYTDKCDSLKCITHDSDITLSALTDVQNLCWVGFKVQVQYFCGGVYSLNICANTWVINMYCCKWWSTSTVYFSGKNESITKIFD